MKSIEEVNDLVNDDMVRVRASKAGDSSAFEQLVRRYDRKAYRIARYITQNPEDAEDAVQEAFLRAYEKLSTFHEQSTFYTWLTRIVINQALMRLRQIHPERMVYLDRDVTTKDVSMAWEIVDWTPNPEQQYSQTELRNILKRVTHGLSSDYRTVFVLRDVEGLSTQETAEVLGVSIPTAKSRLLRARLQLREKLSRYFNRRQCSRKPNSGHEPVRQRLTPSLIAAP